MAQHIGKRLELYMDSYYMSPAVANELANDKTGVSVAKAEVCQRPCKKKKQPKITHTVYMSFVV